MLQAQRKPRLYVLGRPTWPIEVVPYIARVSIPPSRIRENKACRARIVHSFTAYIHRRTAISPPSLLKRHRSNVVVLQGSEKQDLPPNHAKTNSS